MLTCCAAALVVVLVCAGLFISGRRRDRRADSSPEGEEFIILADGGTEERETALYETVSKPPESEAPSDSGPVDLEAAYPEPEEDQKAVISTLKLTEDQKYTGDLVLVSRSYPFDFEKNSESLQLVNIKEFQTWSYPVDKEEFMLAKRIMKSLDAMIHDCDQTMGTNETGISSAWRSYEYQENLWDEINDEYGSDYASKYAARPGYSEHHTGLALDLGIFYDDGSYGQFSDSRNAEWMAKNCCKYGFIRRYAEDKTEITGIANEDWHFRYVGIPHATYMYENNLCLEEYLDYLRENTSEDNPLTIEYGYDSCAVYYCAESEIRKPAHRYEVSGDNRGGYIITVAGN